MSDEISDKSMSRIMNRIAVRAQRLSQQSLSPIAATAVLCLLMLLSAESVKANGVQLAQLATDLNIASTSLASELRYQRFYGGLRNRADRLSRESARLVDLLRSNRSVSRVRSQYRDVSRVYADFEQEFFRASRRSQNDYVNAEVSYISQVFAALSDTYFYSPFYQRQVPVVPVVPVPCGGRCGSYQGRAWIGGLAPGGPVVVNPGFDRRRDHDGRRFQNGRVSGYGTYHGQRQLPQAFSAQPQPSDADLNRGRGSQISAPRFAQPVSPGSISQQQSSRRAGGYHN